MSYLFDFFSLQDPNVRYVLSGTVLLGMSAGALGCFAILRKRALVGDAVAHAVLPGVALGFIVAGGKDPLMLVAGSFLFGLLAMVTLDYITRNSRISSDAATGIVLSVFFGLGVMLLTTIQNQGFADQSGLDDFLFGQAASMVREDVTVFGGLSVLIILLIALAYKELKLVSFDPEYARVIGYPVRRVEFFLAMLMVMTITAGIQAVGVVLMASMLIIPAAAARYWTDSLWVMLILAAFAGATSGIAGSFVSYTAPGMSTGPWMVLAAALLFGVSFFLASRRGLVSEHLRRRRLAERVSGENLLKLLYRMEERDLRTDRMRTVEDLNREQILGRRELYRTMERLRRRGLVECSKGDPQACLLTRNGRSEARRLVRVHRLWEKYLSEHLQIAEDHVHGGAEAMEHLISSDIERELVHLLGAPGTDPHQSRIPYDEDTKISPERTSENDKEDRVASSLGKSASKREDRNTHGTDKENRNVQSPRNPGRDNGGTRT